jgi:MerR family transcriptional regulator, copper efflux regulator
LNPYRERVSTYTIGEVADRTGFSASSLRYYEGIGLLAPASRSGAGYRLYDDHTLAQLAFIARAKQLGCSLDEIADLMAIWDGARCGPVQRRFHGLITQKLRPAKRQVIELTAFAAQLEVAAEQLSGEAVDGPCGDDCACLAPTPDAAARTPPVLSNPQPVDVPIACTLEPGALGGRLAEWRTVLDHVRSRVSTADGGLRIGFDAAADIGRLATLVAAEQRCCPFFSFALTVDHRGLALEVRAPQDAGGIVDELFGRAA